MMFGSLGSKERLKHLRALYVRYERWLIPSALVFGFITDILTFRFINFDMALVALCGHLFFAGLSIVIINLYDEGKLSGTFFGYARLASPLVIQYTFGALFSAFVIFYSHSGSIWASWPFMLVLVFLMIANEIFRRYNVRPDIQLSVYFFALFSFTNLALPYMIRSIGPWVFVTSGLVSVLLVGVFVWVLTRYTQRVRRVKKVIAGGVAVIFVAMNILYFANFIPPIPLAIREIGVYYHVERVDGGYRLTGRERGLRERLVPGERFHMHNSSEGYVFSSVFAPARMDIDLVNEWQYFSSSQGGWVTRSKITFPMVGGRDEGFRGYSMTRQLEPGSWRVNVKTSSGQVIGRKAFRVVLVDEPPPVSTEIK